MSRFLYLGLAVGSMLMFVARVKKDPGVAAVWLAGGLTWGYLWVIAP